MDAHSRTRRILQEADKCRRKIAIRLYKLLELSMKMIIMKGN